MKKIVSVLILFLVSTLTLVSCKISSNDKFTVSFYDEGNIISTQLIESGKNAIKPETPVKNGYVFDNWYSESTLETIFDFNTSITKDTNIYAKWNVSGFTVTYVINGHGQAQDSLTNVTSLPTTLPELSEVGYEFKGWYTDEALTTEAVAGATITTNTTLYAKWNINTYTISFNTNGGSAVADQRVNYNEAASAPTSPTKTGYRFVGWYSDSSLNTAYDFSDSVTSSITLYAKWEEITYSVTYVINGHGQAQESLSNVTSLPTTLPELSEVGYEFKGWYTDEALTIEAVAGATITTNTTLYAKWEEITYSVTYVINGHGQAQESLSNVTSLPTTLPELSEVGYEFKGWYTDEALTIEAVAGATITTNTTLYAKWKINTYIVEFEVLDGTYIAPQTVEYNTAATKPSTDPERNGYRFIGWYTSDDYSQLYDFDSLVTSNIIIYAKWVEDASQVVNTYDVTLVFNNGEENEVCNVKENTVFGTPTEPTKTGYTFVGWYSDVSLSTAYDFSTTVTSDITLYAKWNINTYTVSFDSKGGSAVTSQIVNYNEAASAPTAPTKSGYTFVGWYSDSSLSTAYDFSTAVTEDITLYAKWEELVIDDDAISEDVKYSFRYASDESNGYIYITSSATGTTVVDNKLTLSSPSSSYKFETNNSGWFFFQKGSTVKFTLADSAKITLTMYDASSTYTIVGNGLSSSSSDATQSYTAYAGDVTITSTANGYIGFIEITMVDLSTTPVSMELSYLTTSAGSSTSAGNGTYYTTNVKRIYNVGDDFDPSGICASVTFSDETTSGYVSSSSELSFSGFSSLSAGTCTITVTFTRGSTTLTSTYEVYVISQTPSIIDDVLQVKVDMSYTGTLGAIVDGYNMFTRITDALQYLKNYESTYSSNSKLLVLEAGTYNEKIEVEIPNLTIKGASAETTIIEYDSLYGLQDPNGFTQVTDSTQTMAIREAAKNFTLYEVTVSNWWNSEERFQSKLDFFIGLNDTAFYRNGKIAEHRALAMLIQSDQVVVQNCKLLGYQDTLEGFTGRSIFVDSYISGATDFIFGTNATMYFKNCEIRTIYNGSTDGGYINAFKGCNKGSSDYITYGAIYDGCNFTADAAVTSSNTAIARPWNYYSAVMIMNSTLGAHISKAAYTADTTKNQRYVCWTSGGSTAAEPTSETVKFLEYNNTGDGAISTSQSGVTVLTSQEEANKYNTYSYIFGTTNGAITYSSVWTPVIIEEDEKAVYTVTFNTMGGSSIDSVNVTEGDKLTAPSAPSKDGYVFNGWYTDSSCTTAYNFNSTVTNSFTLYAAWTAASTALTLNAVSGYTEGLYATFDETDASSAAVAYSTDGTTWTSVDSELIRQTSASEARVDVVGLQTGSYSLKVTSSSGKTCIMNNIYVAEDDRSGYAHFGNETGIGAYNNDGTLKSNAVVVYVTDATKNTVTATLGGKTYTGLVSIIQACTSSSYALDIRIIGEISTPQWNSISYGGDPMTLYGGLPTLNSDGSLNTNDLVTSALTGYDAIVAANVNSMSDDLAEGMTILNGLTNKVLSGFDSYFNMCDVKGGYNITIEGIGTDAKIFQWGFEFVQCNSIEVKNLTFSDYTEDAVGFEGSTSAGKESQYGNYWIHNCEFNIGVNNWDVCDDQDKADGDGSTDIKRCHNVTISYVKYNATHKTNLIGANDGCLQYNITLHHNYYNACSSRLPLVRQANIHIYNNYFYGTTSVSSSIRANCYAFIENNYYDGGKNPFNLVTTNNSSYPGFTQAAFKAIGNVFSGSISLSSSSSTVVYSKENTTTDRTSTVSGTNCIPDGSTSYDNFDTNSTLFYYDSTNEVSDVMLLESAEDAKNTVLEYAGVLKTTTSGGPIESGNLYTVTFETNGGSSVSDMVVPEGKTITLPTSTKSGYKLVGWYSDSSLTTAFTSQTSVTSNITLYAKWEEATTYTVTFETNGGSSISSLNVVEGNTISLPTAPTKDGYTFVGWYSDSSLTTAFNESTIISSNITLYAKWRDSSTGELYTPSENISGGGTVFDNDSITLTTNSGTSYVITATGSETATSNDENNFIFTTGLYPGGSSGGYTITAKENCTITIYYTISDSKFASSSDYSKKGNLCVNSVEVESLGDKSNAIAYSYTMEVTAGTTYVLSASSNRLILFGILVK